MLKEKQNFLKNKHKNLLLVTFLTSGMNFMIIGHDLQFGVKFARCLEESVKMVLRRYVDHPDSNLGASY